MLFNISSFSTSKTSPEVNPSNVPLPNLVLSLHISHFNIPFVFNGLVICETFKNKVPYTSVFVVVVHSSIVVLMPFSLLFPGFKVPDNVSCSLLYIIPKLASKVTLGLSVDFHLNQAYVPDAIKITTVNIVTISGRYLFLIPFVKAIIFLSLLLYINYIFF